MSELFETPARCTRRVEQNSEKSAHFERNEKSDSETDNLIEELVRRHMAGKKENPQEQIPTDTPLNSDREDPIVEPVVTQKQKRKATPKQAEYLARAREKAAETRKTQAAERKAAKQQQEKLSYEESVKQAALELLKQKELELSPAVIEEETIVVKKSKPKTKPPVKMKERGRSSPKAKEPELESDEENYYRRETRSIHPTIS